MSSANNFIKRRKTVVSITSERLEHIVWYLAECYNLLIANKPTPVYSKSMIGKKTSFHFEDYLKMEFVDGYLVTNKKLLAARLSGLEEINFSCESVQRFTDLTDGVEKSDKIDITINKLGLKDDWKVEDERLYMAVECKRILQLSDCNDYVIDIEKFCNREYKYLRLPFECQIGFIENPKLDHHSVSIDINKRLSKSTSINTIQPLKQIPVHIYFDGIYLSKHKKNFKGKLNFSIFHLLFNYSTLVVP